MPVYRITKGSSTRTAVLSVESANLLISRGYTVEKLDTIDSITGTASMVLSRPAVYIQRESGNLRALPATTTYGKTVMYLQPTMSLPTTLTTFYNLARDAAISQQTDITKLQDASLRGGTSTLTITPEGMAIIEPTTKTRAQLQEEQAQFTRASTESMMSFTDKLKGYFANFGFGLAGGSITTIAIILILAYVFTRRGK